MRATETNLGLHVYRTLGWLSYFFVLSRVSWSLGRPLIPLGLIPRARSTSTHSHALLYGARHWTQGFTPSRRTLNQLSYSPSSKATFKAEANTPYCSGKVNSKAEIFKTCVAYLIPLLTFKCNNIWAVYSEVPIQCHIYAEFQPMAFEEKAAQGNLGSRQLNPEASVQWRAFCGCWASSVWWESF